MGRANPGLKHAWSGFDFGLCGAPRKCAAAARAGSKIDTAIKSTVTTASTARIRRKQTLGAIVYLTQARHSSYDRDSLALLRRSVQLIGEHYNHAQQDDMVFFHTGDISLAAQHSILGECGQTYARFERLPRSDFSIPPGTPNESTWLQPKAFSVGYRHMIRLFAIGLWGHMARLGYQFVMRLDEDSFILSPIRYNVFTHMSAQGVDYAHRLGVWEVTQACSYARRLNPHDDCGLILLLNDVLLTSQTLVSSALCAVSLKPVI